MFYSSNSQKYSTYLECLCVILLNEYNVYFIFFSRALLVSLNARYHTNCNKTTCRHIGAVHGMILNIILLYLGNTVADGNICVEQVGSMFHSFLQ